MSSVVNASSPNHSNGCLYWEPTNDATFQVANVFILVGLLAWNKLSGMIFLHGAFVIGFLLHAIWAWTSMCARDVFSWNFVFVLLNVAQIAYVLYILLPMKFPPELERVYSNVFQPLKVSRSMFRKLTSAEVCSVKSLEIGKHYATQKVTNTDKLALVVTGLANVVSGTKILHQVGAYQFLDSPEFESGVTSEDKYQVTIVAVEDLRYVNWSRSGLEGLLLKEPYLGIVMGLVIGRDITNKLYILNEKAHPQSHSRPDIRLPVLASRRSATHSGGTQSPVNLSIDASCPSVSGTVQDVNGPSSDHGNDFNESENAGAESARSRHCQVADWVGNSHPPNTRDTSDVLNRL